MTTGQDVGDSRSFERFLLDPSIPGSFHDAPIEVVDLAEGGLRAAHSFAIRRGTIGAVSFFVPGLDDLVQTEGEVVWTRLSRNVSEKGEHLYLSGLRLNTAHETIARAIRFLISLDMASPDRQSLERKRTKQSRSIPRVREHSQTVRVIRQHRKIDEDTLLLVKQAWSYIKQNPIEANKWYNRAKYSLQDTNSPRLHHVDEVLAVWEYLERIVPLETVDWVLDNEHLL